MIEWSILFKITRSPLTRTCTGAPRLAEFGIYHYGLSKVVALPLLIFVSAVRFQTRTNPSENAAAKIGGSFYLLNEMLKHSDLGIACFY